jgi:hypothetical protein
VGDLDIAAKVLMHLVPAPFVGLALGREVEVRSVRAEDKELAAQALVLDKLFEVELAGETTPRWVHVDVAAVWESDLPQRMHDYWSLCRRRAEGPLSSLLICLKPGSRQGKPRNAYEVGEGATQLTFRYALVCAWEWSSEQLFSGSPALIPFVPYARDATPERVDRAIQALRRVEPRQLQADLLAALEAFAKNVFQDVDWAARMPEELIMESTIYKKGEAAGERKGKLEGERKLVEVLLREKLPEHANALVPRLQACGEEQLTDLARLFVHDKPSDELVAEIERVLSGS